MSYPKELVLLNEVSITGTGAQAFRAQIPPYCANPRFQLIVTDLVASGAAPSCSIKLEHAIETGSPEELYDAFQFSADGSSVAYTEQLNTKFPFPLIRANVSLMTDITSFTAKLVGYFDKQ